MSHPASVAAEDGPALQGWQAASPEDAGFSAVALQKIDAAFQNKIDAGQMTGVAYAIARGGKLVRSGACGRTSPGGDTPVGINTVFRLMSMTKPITAVALMMLFDEGRFDLDAPVSRYLPEFKNQVVLRATDSAVGDTVPLDRPMTVRDTLRHTTGYGLGFGGPGTHEALLLEMGLYRGSETLADEIAKIAPIPLATQPGSAWNYSLSPDIQARLVEVLSGQRYADFLQARIFVPLGMTDTAFALRPDMIARLASVSWLSGTGLTAWTEATPPPAFPGLPWPEPIARIDDPSAVYERGAFGLYSTVPDYMRFAQTLLDGGRYASGRLLKAETVALMARDQLGDIPIDWKVKGVGFGLGLAVIRDADATGFAGTEGTFYWDGAAGTIFWIDPRNNLIVVAMAQHLFVPEMDPQALNAALHDLVYAALKT